MSKGFGKLEFMFRIPGLGEGNTFWIANTATVGVLFLWYPGKWEVPSPRSQTLFLVPDPVLTQGHPRYCGAVCWHLAKLSPVVNWIWTPPCKVLPVLEGDRKQDCGWVCAEENPKQPKWSLSCKFPRKLPVFRTSTDSQNAFTSLVLARPINAPPFYEPDISNHICKLFTNLSVLWLHRLQKMFSHRHTNTHTQGERYHTGSSIMLGSSANELPQRRGWSKAALPVALHSPAAVTATAWHQNLTANVIAICLNNRTLLISWNTHNRALQSESPGNYYQSCLWKMLYFSLMENDSN